jgi:hypothetical protein
MAVATAIWQPCVRDRAAPLIKMKKLREVFEYGGVKPVISRRFHRLGANHKIIISQNGKQ